MNVGTEDGGLRWFDTAKAKKFDESRTHAGNNWISDATGSQWAHQCLYLTAKKRWVVHSYSQWQGSKSTAAFVSPVDAGEWLVRNGYSKEACVEVGLAEVFEGLEC